MFCLLAFVMRPQHARAQHRRQRQRHEARHDDRDRDRDGELAEHAADHATHQQHRDEHRDQRERDRNDREADFARALERRLERPHAAFDVTHDVLEHDDGVVDDEPDRQRQRQQRHVVDRETEQRTSPRRCRSSDTGTASAGIMVAETVRRNRKITSMTSLMAMTQRLLHVDHGVADRDRAVVQDLHPDRGRNLGAERRQLVADRSTTATVLASG